MLPFIAEFIGWLGAFFFAICAVPQAYTSWKQKHSRGVNPLFLHLWMGGEICMIVYTILQLNSNIILLTNYIFNAILIIVIYYYMYFPKDKDEDN